MFGILIILFMRDFGYCISPVNIIDIQNSSFLQFPNHVFHNHVLTNKKLFRYVNHASDSATQKFEAGEPRV